MEFPGGSINSESCEADFNHVDSPCSYKRLIFILHENIHATRVETIIYEKLAWVPSQNIPWEAFTLVIRTIWQNNSLTL